MDYRSLILPLRLALIDPTRAINLHATRTANERQGAADLIGGAPPNLLSVTQGPIAQDTWNSDIFINGDQTGVFDTTQKITVLEAGVARSWTIDVASVTFPFGSPPLATDCGDIAFPDGVTRVAGGAVTGTGDSTTLDTTAASVEVRESGGALVLNADGPHCFTRIFPSPLRTRYSFRVKPIDEFP